MSPHAILDEPVPRDLIAALATFNCVVAPFPNEWKGLRNGDLLARVEAESISVLITCDRNMRFQHTIGTRPFALVVPPDQRLVRLLAICEQISQAIKSAAPGHVVLLNRTGQFDVLAP
ncbi:hypothetical protein [Jiella pacifica]|uniref:DUF5615 domain-containing protein n=1 Tax=Jiella pacifica TaxID=2696469 RepID=A0A6N9T108_9HYPH|nr:hypothetical protein [Jiella pacifica]NDW05043.1 hypothetical protein [Jiella pacifica]